MFECYRRWKQKRAEQKEKDRLLDQNGFVAFCTNCGKPLNEQPWEDLKDDTIVYTCACGHKSRFLFGPPAPLFIELDEEVLPVEGKVVEALSTPPES